VSSHCASTNICGKTAGLKRIVAGVVMQLTLLGHLVRTAENSRRSMTKSKMEVVILCAALKFISSAK
jgi:hypothetical protein